jgi:purine-nucleoside phosphorylase
MPYLDASPASLQRMFGISDAECPDAAVIVGQWSQPGYFDRVRAIWPNAVEVEGHSILVEDAGRRIWISVVIGGAMAATITHLAVKLGARAVIQVGSMGGLADGWSVGDVLVPSLVVGRDGVSRQLSRNKPITPDRDLSSLLSNELRARLIDSSVRSGTLVTTTTISLERTLDIARWRRCGYAGVEMECAATTGTAMHFGVPSAGAFVLMDNLAAKHTVFALSDDDNRRIRTGKDAILRASVATVGGTAIARRAMSDGRA